MATTIHVQATREAVRAALLALPAELHAGGPLVDAMMLRVGMTALGHIRRAYITKARGGTDEAGLRWAPLKSSTVAGRRGGKKMSRKERSTRSVETLRDTGILLNSLSPGTNAPGQILEVERNEVTVGTDVPYAKFHHYGTKRMPQRRLWPDPNDWPDSWWEDIAEQAREGLMEVVAQLAMEAK